MLLVLEAGPPAETFSDTRSWQPFMSLNELEQYSQLWSGMFPEYKEPTKRCASFFQSESCEMKKFVFYFGIPDHWVTKNY